MANSITATYWQLVRTPWIYIATGALWRLIMVREASCPDQFRDREVKVGSQAVISPWHLHRHERLWENLD